MSSIKEMKGSVDVKLDELDARADAFQAALAGSKAQIDRESNIIDRWSGRPSTSFYRYRAAERSSD